PLESSAAPSDCTLLIPFVISVTPFFFFNDTPTTEIYTLSLTTLFRSLWTHPSPHESVWLPWLDTQQVGCYLAIGLVVFKETLKRSEEHTSELQSRRDLVCRLLLEKKKKKRDNTNVQKQIKVNVYSYCI